MLNYLVSALFLLCVDITGTSALYRCRTGGILTTYCANPCCGAYPLEHCCLSNLGHIDRRPSSILNHPFTHYTLYSADTLYDVASLSIGRIVGIVIGSIVFVAIVIAVVVAVCVKQASKRRGQVGTVITGPGVQSTNVAVPHPANIGGHPSHSATSQHPPGKPVY